MWPPLKFLHVIRTSNIHKWDVWCILFFHKRKQYMFTIKRQTNKNNFPMLSSYCQKHYSLELSFLWKQSKCKCIIFSVYVTKIPSGDHQCNLLGFLERTDTIPNLSLFNVKDYVRIFNISEISLPTPKTWSVCYKCERFQFRSRSHFGIFPGHWSSRSKQKNTQIQISMEFLQHFRGIQMDTLPVKMAVEFKNIAHFWKYAADEKYIFLKAKIHQKSWGSLAVDTYSLSCAEIHKIFFFGENNLIIMIR